MSREVVDLVWLILGKQALDTLLVESAEIILFAIRVMNTMPRNSDGVDSFGLKATSE
jgi:hypothetical protein